MKYSKLIENNQILMVVSLLCSVILWLSVVYGIDKSGTKVVRDVPVIINMTDSATERLGLSPLISEEIFVDVELSGERSVLGNTTASDIQVSASVAGITKPGTYNLRLEGADYKHRGFEVVNIKPTATTVKFDLIVTKKFPITVELNGFSIPDGYIMNQEYVSPKEVSITGPSTEIEKIANCSVRVTVDQEILHTTTFERDIYIYDSQGKEIKSNFITMDISKTSVTVPVLKKKEVPVTVGFTNIPVGFDMESLDYSINPSILEIAGPPEMIDSMYEINLGYIDMRRLTPGMSVFYDTVLPSSYIAVDNVQDVSVDFASDGYTSKKFKVSDIRLINMPNSYDVTANTKAINEVEIYGFADELEKINENDIIAEIDIANIDIKLGQMVVPVSIAVTSSQKCWAYGEHKAVITVKNK